MRWILLLGERAVLEPFGEVFAVEAGQAVHVGGEVRGEDLDGDFATEGGTPVRLLGFSCHHQWPLGRLKRPPTSVAVRG